MLPIWTPRRRIARVFADRFVAAALTELPDPGGDETNNAGRATDGPVAAFHTGLARLGASLLLLAAGCSSDDPQEIIGSGYVTLLSSPSQLEAFAGYALHQHAPEPCPAAEAIAGCMYSDCTQPLDYPGSVGAGAITVQSAEQELTLEPDEGGLYAPRSEATQLFLGGERLRYRVTGSEDVPPHEAEFSAPPRVLVELPDLTEQPLNIVRSDDLLVRWVGAPKHDVTVQISVEEQDEDTGTARVRGLSCQFVASHDSSKQSGLIPASALRALPLVPDGASASLSVGVWSGVKGWHLPWQYVFIAVSHQRASVTLE